MLTRYRPALGRKADTRVSATSYSGLYRLARQFFTLHLALSLFLAHSVTRSISLYASAWNLTINKSRGDSRRPDRQRRFLRLLN